MASRQYNATTRFHTIRSAMLPALKRIGGSGGGGGGGGGGGRTDPFREVLRLHYRHKLTEFLALLERWKRELRELHADIERGDGKTGGRGGTHYRGMGGGIPSYMEFGAAADEARRALLDMDGGCAGGSGGGGGPSPAKKLRRDEVNLVVEEDVRFGSSSRGGAPAVSFFDQRRVAAAAAESRQAAAALNDAKHA